MTDKIDDLVTAVKAARKYRVISTDLIHRLGEREIAKRRNLKAAVKETKNKLHQIGGAYFEGKLDYEKMLYRLEETADSSSEFSRTCQELMGRHTSTWERLPFLTHFYESTLSGLIDIRVVIDIGCGLNPLARNWMPLPDQIEYIAYDIYGDLIDFIAQYMILAGLNGRAEVRDVTSQPPGESADLAFILKTLPVLEQIEKGAAAKLLDELNCRYLLVSFPAQTLGGRRKGMGFNYESQIRKWLDGRGWLIQRFEFPTELAFLVNCQNQ